MIMTWTNAIATDVAKKWHETRYISNKEELMAFGDGLLWMCKGKKGAKNAHIAFA